MCSPEIPDIGCFSWKFLALPVPVCFYYSTWGKEQNIQGGLKSSKPTPGLALPGQGKSCTPEAPGHPLGLSEPLEMGNRSQGRLKAAQGAMEEPFQGPLPFPRALVHAGFVQLQCNDFIKHLITVISIKMPFKAT